MELFDYRKICQRGEKLLNFVWTVQRYPWRRIDNLYRMLQSPFCLQTQGQGVRTISRPRNWHGDVFRVCTKKQGTYMTVSNLQVSQHNDKAMDWTTGVRFPSGAWIFSSPPLSRPALVPTSPPIQWVPEGLSPGVKRPGRETQHSPPF
jgi:hypothetical protein